jgi:hypothetical protein
LFCVRGDGVYAQDDGDANGIMLDVGGRLVEGDALISMIS